MPSTLPVLTIRLSGTCSGIGCRAAGWVSDLDLDNDGFALLRAGTQAPNRIGVVCGAGINCVGESARGGRFQFPAVGTISGDWGGGAALGMEALFLAVRAEDGRGEETLLREAVLEHFRTASVAEVTEALALRAVAYGSDP